MTFAESSKATGKAMQRREKQLRGIARAARTSANFESGPRALSALTWALIVFCVLSNSILLAVDAGWLPAGNAFDAFFFFAAVCVLATWAVWAVVHAMSGRPEDWFSFIDSKLKAYHPVDRAAHAQLRSEAAKAQMFERDLVLRWVCRERKAIMIAASRTR